jgi:hypothetical protein
MKKKKGPEYQDLENREQKLVNNEEVSELSDSDLEIEYDEKARPQEYIFAELNRGQYFGTLSLQTNEPERMAMRELRNKKCFTSIWCLQNTHSFYMDNDDF